VLLLFYLLIKKKSKMKKLLLGVITFALIITSCNKYADDFQELKDSIAKLATTVNGVVKLQTDLTATQAQITALQAVVATLPTATVQAGQFAAVTTALTGVATTLTGITTTLNAVALAGTANKAVVDKLAVDLAAMATAKTAADLALNTKLDALKAELKTAIETGNATSDGKIAAAQTAILAQIAASAISVNAHVDAQVAAAQAAIAAAITASDAVIDGKITAAKDALALAITAAKDAVNTATAAGQMATNDKIDVLMADLAAGLVNINGNTNAKIAALELALQNIIDLGNAATIAKIDATLLALQGDPTNTDLTALTIQGLQLALAAAQHDISIILVNTSMYNGDVSITNNAEYDFFLAKINQLGIINGNLTVAPAGILDPVKKADVNTILARIQAVIGTGLVNLTTTATSGAINLPLLSSVKLGLTVTNTSSTVSLPALISVGGPVAITNTAGTVALPVLASVAGNVALTNDVLDAISVPALTTVTGNYSITGLMVADDALVTIGGTVNFSRNAPYEWLNAAAIAGGLNITDGSAVTSINVPNATVAGWLNGGAPTFAKATSIIVPGTVGALTGTLATSVKLTKTSQTGSFLTITTPVAAGAAIDLSAMTAAAGVTITNGSTVNMANLATSTADLSITTVAAGTVNLNAFTNIWTTVAPIVPIAVNITIAGAKVVTLPNWIKGQLTAVNATDISMAKQEWALPLVVPTHVTAATLKTLLVGQANFPVDLTPYTALTTANISGKTQTVWSALATTVTTSVANSPALASVTLGGTIKSAVLTDLLGLTTLSTSGVINGIILNNCDAITAVTLGHSQFTSVVDGTPGAFLTATGNALMASLTVTSLNAIVGLNVKGNAALLTLTLPTTPVLANVGPGTFASYVVAGNALRGTFTPAVAAVPGVSPYVEAVIASPEVLKLKPYLAAIQGSTYATKAYNVVYDNDATTPYAAFNLPAAMVANDLVSVAIDQTVAASGIDVATEIPLIQ